MCCLDNIFTSSQLPNQSTMGKMISKMYSVTLREARKYNVEKRAENIISKEKPVPAPKYPSTLLELERLNVENISKEYLHKKDINLDENLKKVYVTTPTLEQKEVEENPNRPLPQNRITDYGISYGYSETEERAVPEGRVSLKQALQFIADHQTDKEKHSNTVIAAQYKLSINLTDDILEHFKMFEGRLISKEKDPASLSSYDKLAERVKGMNLKNISNVVKEFPQFKRKTFSRNKAENGVLSNTEDNDNIQKEEKEKR